MLLGFREGVRCGTYQGKHLISIAMGLDFLNNLVKQSQAQLEMAVKMEKLQRKENSNAPLAS